MERVKTIMKKVFCIHWALSVLLSILAVAGLVWVFGFGNETSLLSYGCYVLAFYALVTACTSLVPKLIRWSKARNEKKQKKSASEKETDFRHSLYRSLVIKLIYAAVNLVIGAVNGSIWLQSMGLYYLVLAVVRAVLGLYEGRMERLTDPVRRYRLGWNGFQICGILLLILHLTTTGVIFQIIRDGQSKAHGEILVIANAAYTFYQVVLAVIGVVRYQRNPSPIWGASRNIDLTEAWMSLFFLQASMLTQFGGGEQFRYLMNTLTGGAVCIMAVFGAIGMIVHGHKRKQQGEMQNGESSVL